MVRTKNQTPAICPICDLDFEGSGKYRYSVLKRHLADQHAESKVVIQNIFNNYSKCTIDQSITVNLHINSINSSDYTKLLGELKGIIGQCIDRKSPMTPEMLKVLHTSNENIVVPNKNKKEVLIKTGVHVETLPIGEGAQLCVNTFIKDGIPKIHNELDKTDMEGSEKCKQRLASESEIYVDMAEKFSDILVKESPLTRKQITMRLKNSI